MEVQRAYAAFTVKELDNGRRRFEGRATSPATDRVSDSIDPLGAKFSNPIILLRQHWHSEPIGRVNLRKPTAKGIDFDAEIPVVTEQSSFKDRCDSAWGEIAYGVIRAVSIGFRPIRYEYKDDGGIHFSEIEIYELSTVSVAALDEAVITAVKSLDGAPLPRNVVDLIRAADGRKTGAVKLIDPRPRGIKLVSR